MDALTAERYAREDRRHAECSKSESSGYVSSRGESTPSQGGACRYPSAAPYRPRERVRTQHSRSYTSDKTESQPEYVKEVYRAIDDCGIDKLRNIPNHIQITCNKSLTLTIDKSTNFPEVKWIFSLKTNKPESLNSIVLYEHRNMFTLGDIFKCNTKGSGRTELKYPYVANRTNYQILQVFNSDFYFEITVSCKPQIGINTVFVIFRLEDGLLLAKEVKVKCQGEQSKIVSENFIKSTKPEPVKVAINEDLLNVNWESGFDLRDTNPNALKYSMPSCIENKISLGFYDNVNDKITKENYTSRFHTLLYLEEYDHKKSLLKYDLQNQKITFDEVEKQITIHNDYGKDYTEFAPEDKRFITFKLQQRLFEGYRSFRPPKIAYIIPNGEKVAYEYRIFRTFADYVIVSISTELIRACERSGGLALVRFTPEREDYVRMHEALDAVNLSVLFPVSRKVSNYPLRGENILLGQLDCEQLSIPQKEAVYSIVGSKYQRFPTIICGPFGCGKTKTLSVAAALITRCYYKARILIVTNTNSAANLYIEMLQRNYDNITMLREGWANRPIMFRHFPRGKEILHRDREVNRFANIQDGVYKRIRFDELEKCSIVVTTTHGCASLVSVNNQDRSSHLFSYIFIDEAAQIIEPEVCIALSFANLDSKIVLAGDIHQTRPLVLSKYGKKYGLDQSLLDRFELLPEFQTDRLHNCKIHLNENFRSRIPIVQFLSKLFYDNSLIASPPPLTGPLKFPALSFLHASGEEKSLHGFPSFYNEIEAELTVKAIKKFVKGGIQVNNIAVLTTYRAQARMVIDFLKLKGSNCRKLGHFSDYLDCIDRNCINERTIEVMNLEGIQGREFDLIIVNTVRTLSDLPEGISFEERLDLGLLDDVTQFNTILTRARGWVLVIGDADCVTKVGECSNVWDKYIEACQNSNGFFESFEEFNSFEIEQTNLKERKEDRPKSQQGSYQLAHPKEQYLSEREQRLDIFESKFNSLHTFMNTCYQDLDSSTHPEVKAAINEQLNFAKFAIETMERQRMLEQQSLLSKVHPRVNLQPHIAPGAAYIAGCDQVTPPQKIHLPQQDIIQLKSINSHKKFHSQPQ